MKVLKWLDNHSEEVILIFLLVVISCIELLQVICRNVPFVPSLTWAEELCRFAWIATVFLSLPYTLRTDSALRVTALIDVFPWKIRNLVNIIVDAINCILLLVLTVAAVTVLQRTIASGETSPAILLPMWIMYTIVLIGFALGAFRGAQMFVIHIMHFNEPPANAMEEQAEMELAAEMRNQQKEAEAEAAKAAEAESASAGEKGGA